MAGSSRLWYVVSGVSGRKAMDYHSIITIEPEKMGGKPCIRGMRVTVYDVLDYLASGMTEDEILHDFPDLRATIFVPALPLPRTVSAGWRAFREVCTEPAEHG